MKGAALRLGLYEHRFFRWRCAGYDMVMIQKSGAIVKACNGEGPAQILGWELSGGELLPVAAEVAFSLWECSRAGARPAERLGPLPGGHGAGTRPTGSGQ